MHFYLQAMKIKNCIIWKAFVIGNISLIMFQVLISFVFYYDNKVITQWWKKCHHKPVDHYIRKMFKKLSPKKKFNLMYLNLACP